MREKDEREGVKKRMRFFFFDIFLKHLVKEINGCSLWRDL